MDQLKVSRHTSEMKEKITENIDNPEILEQLYRENKQDFIKYFTGISDRYNTDLVNFWKIRLASESIKESPGIERIDFLVIIAISLITGILVKIPQLFSGIETEPFYIRNLSFIVFNGIILFTFWQNRSFNIKRILIYGITVLILVLYANLLPDYKSDSILLSHIHIPLFLWCFYGLVYTSFDYKNTDRWIDFIRFNGELLIMTGLIIIAGGLLTGITISLFSVIKIDILKFYTDYIIVFGGVAAPIVSICLIRLYPTITSRIAPVIARIFTPLVLISLIVYLISMIFSKVSINEDRELLMMFNILLISVLAIIMFSVSELERGKIKDNNILVLILLAVLTTMVNSIALVAIISRTLNGLTPNRTVVIISNILVFVNLILITRDLIQSYFGNKQIASVERSVANYLKIYWIWTVAVIFLIPFIFGMK
jgi:hypothetical protein